MKLKEHKFIYQINDKVRIKDLNIKGKVSGIYICDEGITYRIRYFKDFEPRDVYFNSDELELNKDEENLVGFKVK